VTASLSTEELAEIENLIAQNFGVNAADVHIDETYSSGPYTLVLDVKEAVVDPDALVSRFKNVIANQVGVSPSDVRIEYDADSETLKFFLTNDNAEELIAANNFFSKADAASLLTDAVGDEMITVVEVTVDDDTIDLDLDIEIDLEKATNDPEMATNIIVFNLEQDGFTVVDKMNIDNVTHKPSVSPFSPTMSPSFGGRVVIVNIDQKGLTNPVNETELLEQLISIYGVNADDLDVETTYFVAGEIDVSNADDIEATKEAIKGFIAEQLKVPVEDVT